jgi:hypothetical protein
VQRTVLAWFHGDSELALTVLELLALFNPDMA